MAKTYIGNIDAQKSAWQTDHTIGSQKLILQLISICVGASIADEIRDLCSDKLQLSGFNKNYELNKDGEILERLIDIFYIG